MKRLPVIAAVIAVLTLLAFVLRPGREPAPVPPLSNAVNPACLTARNVTDTYQPEPNRADALAARRIAGTEKPPAYIDLFIRRQYSPAFALLQKIDDDGTVAIAALPDSTPDIDNVINQHLANLVWARSMLGIFYEQGRVGRPDPVHAAAFFQKAIDTIFSDDRGCIHFAPISDSIRKHYVAVLVYDMISVENHAKAMSLLEQGGPQFASARFLLSKNLLPMHRFDFFTADLDEMAEDERKNPSQPAKDWLASAALEQDATIDLLGRILLWCAVAVTLLAGGVGLFRYIRRKQGYKDETSIYRTLFAVYDVLHGVVARFGLVAEGLVACFIGLSILAGGFAYDLGNGTNLIVLVTGISSFFGGLSKFVEAVRVSAAAKNTLVHGSARPAAETEAQAAARGNVKAPDLHNRTYKE